MPPSFLFIQKISNHLFPFGIKSKQHNFFYLSIRIGSLVALYMVLERVLRTLTALPSAAYYKPVLIIALVQRWGWLWLIPAVALIAFLFWNGRSLNLAWPQMETGQSLRPFLITVAFILTWVYSTYEFNLYFAQGHYVDRVVLVVLLGLIYWRPVFVLPWLMLLTTIIGQFNYPLGGYSVAEQFVLVRILMLFCALIMIRLATNKWYTAEFLFIVICLIASSYWTSGLGKFRLDWFGYGPHLNNLLFATYANGWLGFLSPNTVSQIGSGITPFIWPMMIGVAFIEGGAIFILSRRQLLPLFLIGFVLFHLGVVLLSGIFFWKIAAVEIALLIFILHKRLDKTISIFTPSHLILSLLLIGGSSIWFNPINLSWYDSAASYVYRFEATDTNGEQSFLTPNFFRPYDYQFTLSAFGFLVEEPQLPVFWGATFDRSIAEMVLAADSPAEVLEIESTYGSINQSPERAAKFATFLTDFLHNWNQRLSKSSGASLLQPPPQLLTFSGDQAFAEQTEITHLKVYHVLVYFDGENYHEIRQRAVLDLPIPSAEEPVTIDDKSS